ncbi:MAG: response regulator transcription factor [Marmoricola sp.]
MTDSASASEAPSRLVLVDDHELIRAGLAGAFSRAGGFEVVGQAGSVAEALEVARATTPDVVVTDLRLPDGSGLDVVRTLRAERPDLALVVLTMDAGDDRLFAAMDAGASGFVGKHMPSEDVITAARHALVAPNTFTASGLVEAMLRRRNAPGPRLTEREAEVLALLAEGLGVAQIAQSLYVAESTAKAHISKIYEKLGAANRAQALMAALRLGLLPDPNQ